ncbi:MAG: tRNA (adenosine(37)-N6)-threonylcarbamoyltransferase complex dimerization subunit type 1 TsaB [Rhizomicrobium sp.]
MKILAVDTAFGACSAALLQDDAVLARRFTVMERGHAEALAPMVEAVMFEAQIGFEALDRLAVTVGPGTFTGQRVGLAFMRGLRLALKKPLTGVTSLAAMTAQARAETGAEHAAAIHDARRGEVYLEIDSDGPHLIRFEDAPAALGGSNGRIALAGTAAHRLAEHLAAPNRQILVSPILAPDAEWVARLVATLPPQSNAPRPLYLRAPDAKLPSPRS